MKPHMDFAKGPRARPRWKIRGCALLCLAMPSCLNFPNIHRKMLNLYMIGIWEEYLEKELVAVILPHIRRYTLPGNVFFAAWGFFFIHDIIGGGENSTAQGTEDIFREVFPNRVPPAPEPP